MSKTVIDELVVSIGLDPKDFQQGSKEVQQATEANKKNIKGMGEAIDAVGEKQDKNNKNTQASNKKTGESFGSVTNSIYKLTAAFLGVSAVKSFVADVTKADSALGRLGRNLNLKPEDLKGFEGVAARFNVDAGAMDAAFENTANMMAKYQTQGILDPAFMEGLARAQVDFGKFLSTSTTDIQRFIMVQDALNKAIDSGRMTRMGAINVGGMMGFSPQVVTMMIETKGHLLDLVAAYKKLNKDTDADTDAADARMEAWYNMTGAIQSASRALMNDMSPALVTIAGLTEKIAQGWKSILDGFTYESGSPMDKLMKGIGFHGAEDAHKENASFTLPGEKERKDAFAAKLKARLNPDFAEQLKARLNPDFAEQLHSKLNARFSHLGHSITSDFTTISALEKEFGLHTGMLRGVYEAESSHGRDTRVSSKGAKGPFQHVPSFSKTWGEKNPLDFTEASRVTARALKKYMLDSGGDEAIALSKYNHRPTDRAVHNNPETMRYIQTVMAIQAQVAANGGQQTPAGNIATTEIHITNLNVNGLNTASATQLADNVKNIAGINNINQGMRQ